MFEASLKEKMQKIFNLKKVTYAHPGDSKEQDCIFISVEQPRIRFKDKRALARVSGEILIQGNSDKMPFGFMSKMIEEANPDFKKDLHFFELEANDKYYQNLVQRTAKFVYFFSTQYDPNVGTIDEVNISIEVNP